MANRRRRSFIIRASRQDDPCHSHLLAWFNTPTDFHPLPPHQSYKPAELPNFTLTIFLHVRDYTQHPVSQTFAFIDPQWSLSYANRGPCVHSSRRRLLPLCAPYPPPLPVTMPLPEVAACRTFKSMLDAAPSWERLSLSRVPAPEILYLLALMGA